MGLGVREECWVLSFDVTDNLEISHRWMKLWRYYRLIMPRKKLPRRWVLLLLLPIKQGNNPVSYTHLTLPTIRA